MQDLAQFDDKKVLTDLAQHAIERVISVGGKLAKEYWARHKIRDVAVYADYLNRRGKQAGEVGNFLFNNVRTKLYDIYVPTTVQTAYRSGDELISLLCEDAQNEKRTAIESTDPLEIANRMSRPTKAFGIIGKAGAGKSLFMKHAFFQIQKVSAGKVPILIELRAFNRSKLTDLDTLIHEHITSLGVGALREQIINGLKSGLFVILFDGIDELKGSIHKHYFPAITEFIDKYPLCPVLISGRPDGKFHALPLVFHSIAPLTKCSSTDLVRKLGFDAVITGEFIDLISEPLFDTHYEFVSNPLLCVITLLTYSDCRRISNSRHEFYEDAFVALWSKHDDRKSGFERHRATGLQKGEFVKLISAFAISSYLVGDYDMRPAQVSRHFEMAKKLTGLSCEEANFLQDLLVSTSLAVEDGPYFRFCHRSFQEYFAAVFICDCSDSVVARFAKEVSDRITTDNVLSMALSIDPDKIEERWVFPLMKNIMQAVSAVGENIYAYAKFTVEAEKVSSISADMANTRHLYEFDPCTSDLMAAYDAARHMGELEGRLSKYDSAERKIFLRDRQNFENLSKRLSKKFEKRSSALKLLLDPPLVTEA